MYVHVCSCISLYVHTYVGLGITETISKFNESLNTTTLTINWTPATNQYCEVLYYLIMLYSNKYNSTRMESGLSTSTVLTGVTDNTLYNIKVTAFNEAGNMSVTKLNVRVSARGLLGFIYVCTYVHCCT